MLVTRVTKKARGTESHSVHGLGSRIAERCGAHLVGRHSAFVSTVFVEYCAESSPLTEGAPVVFSTLGPRANVGRHSLARSPVPLADRTNLSRPRSCTRLSKVGSISSTGLSAHAPARDGRDAATYSSKGLFRPLTKAVPTPRALTSGAVVFGQNRATQSSRGTTYPTPLLLEAAHSGHDPFFVIGFPFSIALVAMASPYGRPLLGPHPVRCYTTPHPSLSEAAHVFPACAVFNSYLFSYHSVEAIPP